MRAHACGDAPATQPGRSRALAERSPGHGSRRGPRCSRSAHSPPWAQAAGPSPQQRGSRRSKPRPGQSPRRRPAPDALPPAARRQALPRRRPPRAAVPGPRRRASPGGMPADRRSPGPLPSRGGRSRRTAPCGRRRRSGRRSPPRRLLRHACRASQRSSRDERASRCSRAESRSRPSCRRSERCPRTRRRRRQEHVRRRPSPSPGRDRGAARPRTDARGRTRTDGEPARRPATSKPAPRTREGRAHRARGRRFAEARRPPCCQFRELSDGSKAALSLSILATKYGGRARCAAHP
jgi:hypothetical protein